MEVCIEGAADILLNFPDSLFGPFFFNYIKTFLRSPAILRSMVVIARTLSSSSKLSNHGLTSGI